MVLATIHNLFFYLDMMGRMRQHICLGRFEEFRRETLAALRGPAAEGDAS
jgi:queuine/archaeosine tRNA-ribosyltransferase